MLALVAALFLAASPQPYGGTLPFPAPRLLQVTDAVKCDFGTVLSIDAARGRMQGPTRAGVVTYVGGSGVQVVAPDGKPVGGIAAVQVGMKYRAYYAIEDGAKVLEIDLE